MRTFVVGLTALIPGLTSQAQYAVFDELTDTIRVQGNTTLGMQATFEAVVYLAPNPDTQFFSAFIVNEHRSGQEDKQLGVYPLHLQGFAWPNSPGNPIIAAECISAGEWHHVAYVIDGVQERLYLDGVRVAARPASSDIGDSAVGGSSFAVGANKRDDFPSIHNSFLGAIDTLRMSSTALYFGESFVPPAGDLTAGASTELLYNFNEPAGASVVIDVSGKGRDGLVGTGFVGATAPTLGAPALLRAPTLADGDLNCDYLIDGVDLGILLAAWGSRSSPADLNHDGVVDGIDLGILLSHWTS